MQAVKFLFTSKQRNDLPRFLNIVINGMIDKNAFKSNPLYFILSGITKEFEAHFKKTGFSEANFKFNVNLQDLLMNFNVSQN